MHEQNHNKAGRQPENYSIEEAAADGRPFSREDVIRSIAEPMQEYALANPLLTHQASEAAVGKSDFSKFLEIGNTTTLHVRLTISPSDDERADAPLWQCSMSLVSSSSGRPKSFMLWTTRERTMIRELLPEFLGERGLKSKQNFTNTKTALHCHRDMSPDELWMVDWSSPLTGTETAAKK